jgi:hypothetical protein
MNRKLNHASTKEGYVAPRNMLGKKHSEETKMKMRMAQRLRFEKRDN